MLAISLAVDDALIDFHDQFMHIPILQQITSQYLKLNYNNLMFIFLIVPHLTAHIYICCEYELI